MRQPADRKMQVAHRSTSASRASGVAKSDLLQLQVMADTYVAGSPAGRLASMLGGAPVQRVLKKIANPITGEWEYYSDRDPDQIRYATPELAAAAEAALPSPLDPVTYNAKTRPPTMFTYADKHPTNTVSNVRQGPHVVGYAAVDKAFDDSRKYFGTIFREQVRSPGEVIDQIMDKLGKLMRKKVVASQVERFESDYTAVFVRVLDLLEDESANEVELTSRIKWLINADPRSSTNWKTRFSVGKSYRVPKSKIGGKGETDDLTDPVNVDTKSADSAKATALWETRKLMLDSESSSDDGSI